MYFTDRFEEASFKERLFFDNLIEEFKLFSPEKWTYYKTSYLGKDTYDYFAQNKITGKKFYIEIKIRDRNWDGYVYETKKHKALMKLKNQDPNNTSILYVNSTPSGTYFWKIDDIIHKYKTTLILMNKATMGGDNKKEKKSVYLLNPDDSSKKLDFRYLDKFMILYERKQNELNKPKSKVRCIFDDPSLD
jgi:hypothetical protein